MSNDTLMTEAPKTTDGDPASQPAAQPSATGADASGQQQPAAASVASTENGEQAQGDENGKKDEGKPEGVPEAYEPFKMPEGVKLDEEISTEFQTLAKELGLSQEAAQKTADLGAKMAQKWAAQQQEQLQVAVADWAKQTQADKEIGGADLDKNVTVAKKALETFGTPELSKLLNDSGLGNHPEVVRTFVRIGKAMSEDKVVTGGAATAPKSAAKTLFPNQA